MNCYPHSFAVLLVGWLTMSIGCQAPEKDSRQLLSEELAQRQQQRQRSMELYEQGLQLHSQSKPEEARETLKQAVGLDGRNGLAWLALGVVEAGDGHFYEAAQAFDRAARLMPNRYEPHYNLGSIFESVRHYPRAIEQYEIALGLAPGQLEVMENLARCYLKANQRLERARELIERALRSEHRPEWIRWLNYQAIRLSSRKDDPDQKDVSYAPDTQQSQRAPTGAVAGQLADQEVNW